MNTKLLRKLLAGLLVCAMLLASVAAFADDEAPAEPTTTPVEDTVDPSDSTDPVDPVTPAAPTDSTDSADDVDENDDATVDEDEDNVDNDEDIVNNDEDNVDNDEDNVNNDEDNVDNDEDNVDNDEDDVKDNENEENVDDEGKPVPPPINIGGVPNVEGTVGEDAEGEGDDANTDNGISLLFFHEHDHQYVSDVDEGSTEPIYILDNFWYNYADEYTHYRVEHYYGGMHCTGCSDWRDLSFNKLSGPYAHVDEGDDGICDYCNEPMKVPVDVDVDVEDGQPEIDSELDENCAHVNTEWHVYDTHVDYNRIPAAYNTKTDRFDIDAEGYKDASVGHIKDITTEYTGECEKCGAVWKSEEEVVFEAHSFKNGKCACGYKKPASSTKKEEDTRVRMGTKLMQEIRALVADGATINLYNENLVYTEAELASVQAISDPFERMLMMLAALGYGDEVDHAIASQGLKVSGAALALIDQLGARPALPGAAAAFLSTEKVNGTNREVVTISLVVSGNGVVTKSFSFYKDGSNFYFFE